MTAKLIRVMRDGTRVAVKLAPKSGPTFAERVAQADRTLARTGSTPDALLRMQRRITWRREYCKVFGA